MLLTRLLLQAVATELTARGIDPHQLVDNYDELMVNVTDTTTGLSGRRLEAAIERLNGVTQDPAFGLRLGFEAPDTMLHVLGHLMLTCETVYERFRVFEQYAALFIPGLEWHFEDQGHQAIFGFSRPNLEENAARYIADWILAFALRLGRQHARKPHGLPYRLELAHRRTSYADKYEQIFGCPVHFEMPAYAIVFPRGLLEIRRRQPDNAIASVLRDATDALYRRSTGASSLTERVRHELSTLESLAEVSFEELASKFGLSQRTMRRRLAGEGQSLSELLDEARCRRAREELKIYDEEIDAIADRLGYAEPNSFKRAFKRWTGQTPFEFRKSAGRAGQQ